MFQFTDDCLIGIKELDDEHRRLFSLINQAMDILNHTDSNDRCTQITHLLDASIAPFCVPLCCRTFFSDLREVNSLRSKVFASRKFTKG